MAHELISSFDNLMNQFQQQMRDEPLPDVEDEQYLLNSLEQRISQFQSSIKRQRNARTPIGRLPDELVLKVFWHCVEGLAEAEFTRKGPLRFWAPLIQTCSRWRALGRQDRALWSEINLLWPSKGIEQFLDLSGQHSLSLFIRFQSDAVTLLRRDILKFSSYLSLCASRLSEICISVAFTLPQGMLEEFITDHVVPLNMPSLRLFSASRGAPRDNPLIIPMAISSGLKSLILRGIKHPFPQPYYAGLTALHIHEISYSLSDFFALLDSNPFLATLELSAGIEETPERSREEGIDVRSHLNLTTLRLGPVSANGVIFIFAKAKLPSLNELRVQIRHESREGELPVTLRPLVRGSCGLRVYEDFSTKTACLTFYLHPLRMYDICFEVANVRHIPVYDWESFISRMVPSCPPLQLTSLDVDIRSLPDADVWSFFLRRCGATITRMCFSTYDLKSFVEAVKSDMGLLPDLESLDISHSGIIHRSLVEWVEFREGGHSRLRTLVLPNQFDWDVSWPRLHALAEDVVIEDVESTEAWPITRTRLPFH
ncbi:hypothetical protein SISNIDRAFT_487704 [Sistotremastrum niveocremeum HHB9708]|uniref:Uncharacterized protein n=1 Tax=Sistotremastrum niveocremeum HHB9708 TaxID=1314777 RepID=A0A164RZ47_9AGAM|nr:hypothetical protein SISNIDRAFT_487704 [Sistotremastrum niveocremeum HHB9708]